MKYLLWILGVIALLLVIAGALNYGTDVSIDYVAGTTPSFSLFWVALVAAAALFVAAFLGWTAGRAGSGATRRKLEHELEATYRRLREAEARLPRPALTSADEPATTALVAPADESATATIGASPDNAVTTVTAPEGETAEGSAESHDATAVASVPPDETSAAEDFDSEATDRS